MKNKKINKKFKKCAREKCKSSSEEVFGMTLITRRNQKAHVTKSSRPTYTHIPQLARLGNCPEV